MEEAFITLGSVLFGASLTFVYQWLAELRKSKEKLKKEKIIIYSHFLKTDIMNGPDKDIIHITHFDDEIYCNEIYPLFLDNYIYYPESIREKMDRIYFEIKNVELYDIPEEISKRDFCIYIGGLYRESVTLIRKELIELING